MVNELLQTIDELYSEMVDIRRDLHMYPELSFQEVRTPQVIADYLANLGLEVRTEVGGRGVVARLRGGKPGKTVALRADFDALPIEEENDVPYKSKTLGVMHACGHDAHTAVVLGIAKALIQFRDEIQGDVVFIHQHAEESLGGAKFMVEDGCLDGVDAIFATHMENYAEVGEVQYTYGYILAASDRFQIEIEGRGGHAAFPHDTQDALFIGSQLVCNLQQIVSRRVDPLKSAVVTVGSFHAGETGNVIAESARIMGTVRVFDEKVRQNIKDMIEKITASTCQMSGARYRLNYDDGYPGTFNHERETTILVESAKHVVGEDKVVRYEPNMGAEDFSYYTNKIPGSYFFTGSANRKQGLIYPYHHPRFDIDERALLVGAKTLAVTALNYLSRSVDD